MGLVSAKRNIILFTPKEYPDEVWTLRPQDNQASMDALAKSQIKEIVRGEIVEKADDNLFRRETINHLIADWQGVGIEHADGRIENPAACTLENKLLVIAMRPLDFLLTLRRVAEDAARYGVQQAEESRANFYGMSSNASTTPMPIAGSVETSTSPET